MPSADFQQTQLAFAAYIRDPKNNPAPSDVPADRMAAYHELFFNNIEGFLTSNFPVLRTLYRDDDWKKLAQDFFTNHQSQTPYFSKIGEEFLDFVENEREPRPEDPPFLLELAHYEWVELDLVLSDPPEKIATLDSSELLNAIPLLSPASYLLAYAYPVHQISVDFQPTEPSETPHYLVAYQDSDHEVLFLEVNAITARLLELIENNQQQKTGQALLATIAQELQQNSEEIINAGQEILATLHKKQIITGSYPAK